MHRSCSLLPSIVWKKSSRWSGPIAGLDSAAELEDVKVFHAGTKLTNGKVANNGSRVLGVTALGDDLAAAKSKAYEAVNRIEWDGGWFRSDISDKASL